MNIVALNQFYKNTPVHTCSALNSMESMSFCCGNTAHAMCLNNFTIETVAQDGNFISTMEMVTNTVDYPGNRHDFNWNKLNSIELKLNEMKIKQVLFQSQWIRCTFEIVHQMSIVQWK